MCHAGCDMLWFWMILAFICWCEIHLQLGFDYTSDFIRLQILGLPVKRLAGDSWGRFGLIPEMLICIVTPWLPWRGPDGWQLSKTWCWHVPAQKQNIYGASKITRLPRLQINSDPKKEPRFEGMPVTSCCHWYHTPVKLGYQKQPQVPTLTQTQARQILQIGGSKLFNTWITWFMFNPIWEEERKWLSYFQGSSKRSIRPCGHNPVT